MVVHTQFKSKTMVRKLLCELTPEQKHAIQILVSNWPTIEKIQSCTSIPTNLSTGYTRFSHQTVYNNDLPVHEFWSWRQSNAKVRTKLDENTTLVIQKFNARKKKLSQFKPPTYKLWNIRVQQKTVAFTFLYCERGVSDSSIEFINQNDTFDVTSQILFDDQSNYGEEILNLLSIDFPSLLDEKDIEEILAR